MRIRMRDLTVQQISLVRSMPDPPEGVTRILLPPGHDYITITQFHEIRHESTRVEREIHEIRSAQVEFSEETRRIIGRRHDPRLIEVEFDTTPRNQSIGNLFRDKLWVTKDGDIVAIRSMSDTHLVSTIKMLKRLGSLPSKLQRSLQMLEEEQEQRILNEINRVNAPAQTRRIRIRR